MEGFRSEQYPDSGANKQLKPGDEVMFKGSLTGSRFQVQRVLDDGSVTLTGSPDGMGRPFDPSQLKKVTPTNF